MSKTIETIVNALLLIALSVTGAGLGGVYLMGDAHAATPDTVTVKPVKTWKPCRQEDSLNCVMDARHMGNGIGDSFKAKRNGERVYISHRRAHRLLNLG